MTSLPQFENILKEMEQALIANDIEKIQELTVRQQTGLSDLIVHAQSNAFFKRVLKESMPRIQEQLERNDSLLQQALQLTESIMNAYYERAGGLEGPGHREYSSQAFSG